VADFALDFFSLQILTASGPRALSLALGPRLVPVGFRSDCGFAVAGARALGFSAAGLAFTFPSRKCGGFEPPSLGLFGLVSLEICCRVAEGQRDFSRDFWRARTIASSCSHPPRLLFSSTLRFVSAPVFPILIQAKAIL
jgi:hypothetical protein